ncbi:MAG: hypothetical protein ACLQDV_10450 [Candidatus Binataceae bacterium]
MGYLPGTIGALPRFLDELLDFVESEVAEVKEREGPNRGLGRMFGRFDHSHRL